MTLGGFIFASHDLELASLGLVQAGVAGSFARDRHVAWIARAFPAFGPVLTLGVVVFAPTLINITVEESV